MIEEIVPAVLKPWETRSPVAAGTSVLVRAKTAGTLHTASIDKSTERIAPPKCLRRQDSATVMSEIYQDPFGGLSAEKSAHAPDAAKGRQDKNATRHFFRSTAVIHTPVSITGA